MLPTVPYTLRSFTLPPGFTILNPTTNVFNNNTIGNLYPQIASCFGKRIGAIVQNAKKGIKSSFDSKSRYLLMALYVLRRWYNGGFTIPILTTNGTITIYWEGSLTETATTQLLVTVTVSGTYSQIAAQIQNALPPGYTVTVVNTSYIYVSTVGQLQAYVYYTYAGGSTGSVQLDYNPLLPYSTVQQIIENCIRICRMSECNTLSCLESDNVYVPLGQPQPNLLPFPSNYQNVFSVIQQASPYIPGGSFDNSFGSSFD